MALSRNGDVVSLSRKEESQVESFCYNPREPSNRNGVAATLEPSRCFLDSFDNQRLSYYHISLGNNKSIKGVTWKVKFDS